MASPILLSKLYVPPTRARQIERQKLFQHLDACEQSGQRFFLISAPAGFGKSTLASAWIKHKGLPVAWITLDEADNEPAQFFRYLIHAVRSQREEFGNELLQLLQTASPPSPSSLIFLILTELEQNPTRLAIVLDDFHNIHSDEILNPLSFFIDHLPSAIHLFLLTRSDPALQLPKYRGRSQMCEVRASDLRFDLEESAQFLHHMGLALHERQVAMLADRTEGWAAGLHLAALSIQGQHDTEEFIRRFDGDDRYVADYLVDEVLSHLPEDIKDFLLRTSILDRFNADLCNQLSERNDSQAIINQLDRENLFIIPLDNRREWYRYHHLFASLLQQILKETYEPSILESLHQKTLDWFRSKSQLTDAALFAINTGNYSAALGLVLEASDQLFKANDLGTIRQWGSLYPDDILRNFPSLCLLFGWSSHASGRSTEARRYIRLIEEHFHVKIIDLLQSQDGFSKLDDQTRVCVVEAAIIVSRLILDENQPALVIDCCNKIRPYLDPSYDRGPIIFNIPSTLNPPLDFIQGLAHKTLGETAAASHYLEQALTGAHKTQNAHVIALAASHLGWINIQQGKLFEARRIFEEGIRLAKNADNPVSPYISVSRVGLGHVLLELGETEQAIDSIEEGLKYGGFWRSWEVLLPGSWDRMRIHLQAGRTDLARMLLHPLKQLSENEPANIKRSIELLETYLDCYQGNLNQARSWLWVNREDLFRGYVHLYESGRFILAQICAWLGQDDEEQALLQQILSECDTHGKDGSRLEACLLMAELFERQQRHTDADQYLTRAMEIAVVTGHQYSFLRPGEAYRRILLRAVSGRYGQIARTILQRVRDLPTTTTTNKTVLTGPLSERESEILALIAGGKSNTEISQQLVISPNTLKKHINNIFGKLHADSRLHAIQIARELGILDH